MLPPDPTPRTLAVLICAALLACTGSQPAAPARTPVATPQPAAVPESPRETRPAPAPAPAEPEPELADAMPYPRGIVPGYDELAGVIVRPQELAGAEPLAGPLARISECAAEPAACEYPVGVLGFHADGRVAVIEAAAIGGCAQDEDPLAAWGRVARADALESAAKTAFKPSKADPSGRTSAQQFVVKQAKAGFKTPDDAAFLTGSEEVGVDGVTSLAILREPLAGWLLHAKAGDDQSLIQLVDPANRTAHVLATLPGGATRPSLEQVVFDPDRRHLWVTLAFNDGGHCADKPVKIHRWPLPASVTPTNP